MRRILLLIAFFAWTVSACAQESGIQEGVHYTKIDVEPAAPGQVEVIEFFSYTCPHCASFAPYIHRWEKKQSSDVKVTYIPVVFHESLMNYAKAHYAAELLEVLDKVQPLIFESIHVKNQPLIKSPILQPVSAWTRKNFLKRWILSRSTAACAVGCKEHRNTGYPAYPRLP
jgi:protein dithiol oxidoreductase (disulfide-forming)